MNILLRPDQELAIQEAIRAGLIGNEIDALDIGLENLRTRLTERNTKESSSRKIEKNSLVDNFISLKFDELTFNRTPQEAAAHIRELRKGNSLPKGVTLHDLINEGRE